MKKWSLNMCSIKIHIIIVTAITILHKVPGKHFTCTDSFNPQTIWGTSL